MLADQSPFQSTRPRKSATIFRSHITLFCDVSIHAPPKERDNAERYQPQQHTVSIHAPPKERDLRTIVPLQLRNCFNPRAPERARPTAQFAIWVIKPFQSTRPRKSATCRACVRAGCKTFQSTRPRKSATSSCVAKHSVVCFNPRAPERARRGLGAGIRGPMMVSIHAPPKERDLDAAPQLRRTQRFNPRAPERARRHCPQNQTATAQFQSTRPRKSATRFGVQRRCDCSCFNPRAPERARQSTCSQKRKRDSFNPRAPERARPGAML